MQERTAQCLLAERGLLEGRPEAARACVHRLLDRDGMEERMVTNYVLPVLAWAYLDLGEVEQAASAVAEALRRQRAGQYRFGLVSALRVQAQVSIRRGDRHSAAQALEEGLGLARARPYPHHEGRLLETYGWVRLAYDPKSVPKQGAQAQTHKRTHA